MTDDTPPPPEAGGPPVPRPPSADERMPCLTVPPPHPAMRPAETLLEACRLRAQRRSGPGGQHRNKTSSGVFLEHRPTGLIGEATERRSQAQNRTVALTRLRLNLAVALRSAPHPAGETGPEETRLRHRYRGGKMRLADDNPDKPGLLAAVLDDLHAAGGQPSLVARQWGVSTSAIIALAHSHRPAWDLLQAIRRHHGRPPLKPSR